VRPTTSRTGKKWRYGTAAVAVLTLGVASACSSSSSSTPAASGSSAASGSASASGNGGTLSFPRNETLYTSGTAYGPPVNWNPLAIGAMATGTQGLIYEPLYLYDPLKNTYQSWLASSDEAGGWQGNKYVMTVRSGVKWSDGQPMTAADVAYSINLARTNSADPFSPNVATVANAVASGSTVTVTFKGTPGYPEFEDYLWKAPVLPQHIWSKIAPDKIATDANTKPVGTGPMTLDTANTQEVAYQTKTDWWATSALSLSFKFKYLVDVVNGSNSQELGQLNSGNIDWSNNYLPGINMLASAQGGNSGYTLKFFYAKSPYMLSGNTVWLEPNTTKAPMNNVNFRKAMAAALNPQAIAQAVYGGIASPATPTGLLPTLKTAGFVDQAAEKQYGTTYDPAKAKTLLAQSGYNGRTLTLEAPQGWSDWNSAQQVIAQELNAVGIKVQVTMPSFNQRTADITNGNYDLALDNNANLDSTPWSYFQRVYQLPIQKQQTSQQNWERYSSPADWALVQKAAATPPSDTATLKQTYSTLEKDFLQQQPQIPLWYNGIWFQGNTQYWSNFPSSTGSNQNVPAMWYGYLGAMTGVPALAQLTPTPQKAS
jgi:peptide/nickel transport system substrate-binding protein